MKRFLSLLLAVLLLTALSAAAFAESPETSPAPVDIGTMSNDALLELYAQIRDEMKARGLLAAQTLKSGQYIIGQDIEPGTYKITCTGTDGEDLSDTYDSLGSIYSSILGEEWGNLMSSAGSMLEAVSEMTLEIVGSYGSVERTVTMKSGDTVTITLQEGTALNVEDGTCSIELQ